MLRFFVALAIVQGLGGCASARKPAVPTERSGAQEPALRPSPLTLEARQSATARRLVHQAEQIFAQAQANGARDLASEPLADASHAISEAKWLLEVEGTAGIGVKASAQRALTLAQTALAATEQARVAAQAPSPPPESGWRTWIKKAWLRDVAIGLVILIVGFLLGFRFGKRRGKHPLRAAPPVSAAGARDRAA